MSLKTEEKCPCHSGKLYADCCKPYHLGKPAENASLLMRSRYSAYALAEVGYIIKTTHPKNPVFLEKRKNIEESIRSFSQNTAFLGLTILSFEEGIKESFVTFTAILKQQGQDASFTERSRFLLENGQWLYVDGKISPPLTAIS